MKPLSNKQLIIIAIFCVAALGAALALFVPQKAKKARLPVHGPTPAAVSAPTSTVPVVEKVPVPERLAIGLSVQGRSIESYTFGGGKTRLVFAGGIHGGYEWNSALLAYQLIDYLDKNPESIPENLSITVIPVVNPDGMFKITGKEGRFSIADVPAGSNDAGRLNAHGVDLNRNFGCNWKAAAVWKNKPVSAGTAAFSEPESAAIKKFILENDPAAVVFWHSQSDAIYGSQCGGDMLAQTREIMDAYSKASGYRAVITFDQYEVTGDVTDWLASIGKAAMTVELKTHEGTEWERNLAGIRALFKYYGGK